MKNIKKNGGFTLVELIVVIAILAILAAVAIPAYSGYIEKANKAGDDQLVAAVNRAFFSACIENAIDPYSVTDAAIQVSSKVIGNVTSVTVPTGNTAGIPASFTAYFAGNEGATFKVYGSLEYNPEIHNFEGVETAVGGVYAGLMNALKNQSAWVGALKDSTFGSTMGMEALMGQLDQVTWIATGMTDMDAMQQIFNSAEFHASAMQALGLEGSASQLLTKLDDLKNQVIANNEGIDPALAEDRVYANAAVLYTAQLTAGMSKDEATKLFEDATRDGILAKMSSGDGEGLAQAALVCGMYTAYSKQPGTTVPGEVNVQNVLNALQTDTGFNNYLQSEQGKKDLDGYLASLQMLNSTTQGSNAAEVENLMVNGFADQDLIAGLNGLIGN